MSSSPRTSCRLSLEEITQLLKPVALAPLCENPLVSVLTVNYNYARYLGEAIESVLSQTYTNFEMIVCDDGSTDDSCEVAEHYAQRDPRIRLVRKQNGGQVSASNAAYRECRGEIVCFLDSDDRYLPEKLETVVQAFRSHPDSGFVGHRIFRINAVGRQDGVMPSFGDPPSGWCGPSIVRHGVSPRGMSFGSALCLRREIGDSIFPVPEGFTSCADVVIMVLAPLMTPIVGIAAPLGEYRYHGTNLVNSPRFSLESSDRLRHFQSMVWEVRREYLGKVDGSLVDVFPSIDEGRDTLLNAYIRARLETWWGGALSAYRNLLRAESFLTLRFVTRWFWRLSVLLPRPAIRYALRPNAMGRLFWRAAEFRRRHFAS